MSKPTYLQVSYPNFVVNQTADPDQIDQNNADIVKKVNETLDYVDEVANGFTAGAVPDGSITQAKLAFDPTTIVAQQATNADKIDNLHVVDLDNRYMRPRNVLINSNFDVCQRGSNLFPAWTGVDVGGYGLDRWYVQAKSGTGGGSFVADAVKPSQQSCTVGQTDVPNEPRYFSRLSISSVPALGGGAGLIRQVQRIEDVRTLAGKTATVVFYAKADKPTPCAVGTLQVFGTGGSGAVQTLGSVVTLSNVWQKFVVTINIPSILGKTIAGNDHFLELFFCIYKQDNALYYVPNGSLGTWQPVVFDLAQVSFYDGNVELPYRAKSFAEELQLCQRYYETTYDYGTNPGTVTYNGCFEWSSNGSANERVSIPYKVTKRVPGSIAVYSPNTGAINKIWSFGANADVSATNSNSGLQGCTPMVNSIVVNANSFLRVHVVCDAEI